MDNPNNIDNYFKEHLENLEAETSQNRWKKLYWMLIYKKVLVWTLVGGIAVALFFMMFNTTDDNSNLVVSNEPSAIPIESIKIVETPTTFQDKTIPSSTKNQKNPSESTQIVLTENTKQQSAKIPEIISKEKQQNTVSIYPGNEISEFSEGYKELSSIPKKLNTISFFGFSNIKSIYPYLTENNISKSGVLNEGDENNPPKTKKALWSTGAFLNPNYVITSLSGDAAYNDYLTNRRNSEESIFTVGASAEIKLSLGHFFLQSGLDYSVYGQNGNYRFTTDEIDYENSYYNYDTTWVWIYDPPDAYPYPIVTDSTFVPDYFVKTSFAKNRYTYLEIPLIVGVQFAGDKKTSFEIGTGVSFGFLVSTKGQLPSLDGNSLTELNKSDAFLQNTSLNFIVQSGVRFRLSDKTSFTIRPYYKGSLQSNFEKNFPVSQKFRTLGISFGMNIKL